MPTALSRLGRVSSIALLGAAVWASALVAAGFLVPVYTTETVSSSGELAQRTETVVGANGPGAVVVLAVPLLATVLVACALLVPARAGLPVAWALTALLGVLTVLGMLTIGVFVLPVTAALVVACASASRARR